MAVITAEGQSYHAPLGGASYWFAAEFTYLTLSFQSQTVATPPPFDVYPSWRRPWRKISAT